MVSIKNFAALWCVLLFLLAFGCTSLDKPDKKSVDLPEINQFKSWALADSDDKIQYELINVSLGQKPYLSDVFFNSTFSNFNLKNVSVCPLINGVCWHEEDGKELTFSIEADNIKFADGYIRFNSVGQIIKYDGPVKDLPLELINENEARVTAMVSSACNNNELGPIMNAPGTPYYDFEGSVFWKFGVETSRPSCWAECIVNAEDKTVEPAWRCVMSP
ncbi:hypothetical protein KKF81_05810 [Candidatus Micrarchaeota archaeon]|nr:hypothetical protein [Candidatus Micrarchaeota archaeon]MBU1166445.1 hypothetical protein [Candidatus Micrarchaeota archaeon]MBU1886548.1 hypothetical protein [Candidatus Micrarchaeota archaeon]